MRKVLLVIGLIGASFAGGAAINGPGQGLLRNVLLRDERIDTAPISALPMAGAGAAVDQVEAAAEARADAESAARNSARSGATSAPPVDPFPAAPLPALGEALDDPADTPPLEPPRGTRDASNGSTSAPRTAAADPEVSSIPTAPPAPPAPAEVPAPRPPAVADAPPRLQPTPPSEGSSPDAGPIVDPPPALTSPAAARFPPADPSLNRAHATTEGGGPAVGDTLGPSGSTDWRARLAAAGVGRYWIEGEPSGRVRLRAVIPLAGETAVGEQFEAEADDEPGAVALIVKRIALWRATREEGSP